MLPIMKRGAAGVNVTITFQTVDGSASSLGN